jgi:membrane protease YdiL (CAAX protease family)
MIAVLVLWTCAHSVSRWVWPMDSCPPEVRFAWWTGARFVAWLVPTWMLLRQCGAASADMLGLTTGKGLGIALVCATLWIGMQELGTWLQLPLFSRPQADLSWYSLAGSLLVSPFTEELMFRGAMLRTMKREGYAPGLSIFLSGLAFAMLHVPGWIFRRGFDVSLGGLFVSIWLFGTLAGLLAWRVPSLWAPVLLHFANNFWSTGALTWSLDRITD